MSDFHSFAVSSSFIREMAKKPILRPLMNMVWAGCKRSLCAKAARNLVRMRANRASASCDLRLGRIHFHGESRLALIPPCPLERCRRPCSP